MLAREYLFMLTIYSEDVWYKFVELLQVDESFFETLARSIMKAILCELRLSLKAEAFAPCGKEVITAWVRSP